MLKKKNEQRLVFYLLLLNEYTIFNGKWWIFQLIEQNIFDL